MLTNEVLHKTKNSNSDFFLLKLDMIKAFDCLGWKFLIRLLIHLGFGPNFIQAIEATNVLATLVVLVQGYMGKPFHLKRSLRQGCPLSLLLYLLVANALSWMLTNTSDLGLIRGVTILETRE